MKYVKNLFWFPNKLLNAKNRYIIVLYLTSNVFISQNFVPDEKKDEKYWERRKKNNDAARMSREAKRQKENQIIMRAAHLETENSSLRSEIQNFNDQNDDIRTDVKHLQEKLATYEADNDDSGYFWMKLTNYHTKCWMFFFVKIGTDLDMYIPCCRHTFLTTFQYRINRRKAILNSWILKYCQKAYLILPPLLSESPNVGRVILSFFYISQNH